MRRDDKIKDIVDTLYRDIELPAGFEERLSKKIDTFSSETKQIDYRPSSRRKYIYAASAVAAVVVAISVVLFNPTRSNEPLLAQNEMSAEDVNEHLNYALSTLSSALKQGKEGIEKSASITAHSVERVKQSINF